MSLANGGFTVAIDEMINPGPDQRLAGHPRGGGGRLVADEAGQGRAAAAL
jgi:hypothetical protein